MQKRRTRGRSSLSCPGCSIWTRAMTSSSDGDKVSVSREGHLLRRWRWDRCAVSHKRGRGAVRRASWRRLQCHVASHRPDTLVAHVAVHQHVAGCAPKPRLASVAGFGASSDGVKSGRRTRNIVSRLAICSAELRVFFSVDQSQGNSVDDGLRFGGFTASPGDANDF